MALATDSGSGAILRACHAAAVAASRDAVIITDVDDAVIDANPTAELMLGCRRDELVGRPVVRLLDPLTVRGSVLEEVRRDRSWAGDVGFTHSGGARGVAESTVAPVFDEEGRFIGAAWLCRDVTAARLARVTVVEAEQQWWLTIDRAPVGIALVDLDGRWLRVNDEVCRIVGYSAEELLQRTFQDLTHPADLDADLSLLARLMVGEIPHYRMEKRYFHARGHEVWVSLSVTLANREDGEPLHLIAHMEDITQRRAMIHELEQRANHDELTGLANRSTLLKELDAHRRHTPDRGFAVVFVDLDGFKTINDVYGHAAGDGLLTMAGHRLTSALRPGDLAARLGGDEFAVLLVAPGGDEAVRHITQRILDSLAAPYHLPCGTVTVTASIGVVIGDTEVTCSDLVNRADAAMYQAKRQGKNTYVLG